MAFSGHFKDYLRPYPLSVNFWDHHRARFLEKNLVLRKLYVQIECQLGYLIMLISNDMCQYKRKYAVLNKNICHFLGSSPSALSGKNPKHRKIYKWYNAALWFFPGKRARWRSHFLDFFFQDSRIRVIVTGPWSRGMDHGLYYRLWSRETIFYSHGTMVSSHETMVSSHRTIGQNVVVLIMIKRFYHNRYPVRFVFLWTS